MSEAETPAEPPPSAAPTYTPGSRRVLAAVANIFAPGSGQLLLGRTRRALVVFAAFAVGMALLPYWPYAFFFAGAVWVAAIIDSGITRPLRYPTTSRCVGIIILTFFGVFMVRSMVMRYYAEAFNVAHNDMAPTVRRGDIIVAGKDVGAAAVGQPIVYADPCHKDKHRLGRIVAHGGDEVEVRCGTLYVNGTEVPHGKTDGSCVFYVSARDGGWVEQTCERMTETLAGVTHPIARLPDIPASAHDFPSLAADAPAPACPPEAKDEDGDDKSEEKPPVPPAAQPAPPSCQPTKAFRVPADQFFILGDNRDDSIDSRTFGPLPAKAVIGQVRTIWWSTAPERGAQWNRLTRVH